MRVEGGREEMVIKTRVELDKDRLIDKIYQDTQLEHKKIREVLQSLVSHLYDIRLIDYD